ncbi:MAG: isochorismatase family protein [Nanoarchaeota archaeon]|nr:isochorismatase family protein [Nanoarchaeota archaeon]MBU1501515.1 isochorismatase family protein [Nanoarchaeota archaeon]MBU2459031.1 isochorismatase family protein [Nanoarchaeota archaeon]
MNKIKIISVDFQKDFTSKEGICFRPRKSVRFVKETLVPFLNKNNIKIAEIISDYRQPRPGDRGDCCHPGKEGYESEVPKEVKIKPSWIKCMNSPIWTRRNIGIKDAKPGIPYQDSKKFNQWLSKTIGKPKEKEVILIGLTTDCCVLCTAQELSWRGYKVRILEEATDTYSGKEKEKAQLLKNPPLINWTKSISWKELKEILE